MAAKEVAKDKIICSEGQNLDAIHIIASGSVSAKFPGGAITLKKGDIVGLCDIAYDSHFFTYTTLENSSFVSFAATDERSLAALIRTNPELAKMTYTSVINQLAQVMDSLSNTKRESTELLSYVKSLYNTYLDLCARNNVISKSLPGMDIFEAPNPEEDVAEWVLSYYSCIKDFPQDLKHSLASRVPFLIGFLFKASKDIHSAFSASEEYSEYLCDIYKLLLQESRLDLFDMYSSLLLRLKPGTPDYEKTLGTINKIIQVVEKTNYIGAYLFDSRVSEFKSKMSSLNSVTAASSEETATVNSDLANSVDIILEYADINQTTAAEFKSLLAKYKKLPDKGSSDDVARKLRLELTKHFYAIYREAFQISVMDVTIPPIIKMFFNFGYMDAELCGIENANYLYSIVNDFRGDSDSGIYTAYEWITAIYRLRKDPSRNEFDVDYLEYIREQKMQNKIDAEIEKRLINDPGERVLFELNNMFPLVNKMTYGRLSTFCPILSEGDIVKPLQTCLSTVETINAAIAKIEEIDYGAFYKEVVYTNPTVGINKEYLHTRVTPDIILLPNIGTRGVMWQEIEGKKRTTPARFMISVFHMEDIVNTIARLTGEYRWEMCKRIQGGRWNDISEKSLTSEYCDYIQFYRKNSELSADAKEKIKNNLVKAKNSFKEMFVRDYLTWIMYEGTGSPRLNKISRSIMLTYCPFPKAVRDKVAINPMFKDLVERYNIKTEQKLHHIDNVIAKLRASGHEIPEEFITQKKYINGML